MTLTEPQTDIFYTALQEQYNLCSPSGSRAKAWERFQEKKFTGKKSEAFSYVPLRQLLSLALSSPFATTLCKEDLASHIYQECKDSLLVFVDGVFSLELSSTKALESVTILPLSIAQKGSYGSFLQRRMQQSMEQEQDPFALLNMALSKEGAFVFVPPRLELAAPIQCLFVTTSDHIATFPRVHIALGSEAKASLVTTSAHFASTEGLFQSALIDIALDEASHLEHSLYLDLPKKAWSFAAVRASLKKQSTLECINASTGSKSARQDYRATLVGEESDAKISGLCWLEENHQSHVHVLVEHIAPNCTSNQFFKGALSGISQSSFTGKIFVGQKAQKTQAYQLNNNLLLAEGPIAYSKPGLEILADDVKASHGATMTQLSDDQLFYLKSRGLSEETAKTLLVLGFCKEILDKISCKSLKQQALDSLQKYLAKLAK
jgi:Fe-S cluster assembly protein SufD